MPVCPKGCDVPGELNQRGDLLRNRETILIVLVESIQRSIALKVSENSASRLVCPPKGFAGEHIRILSLTTCGLILKGDELFFFYFLLLFSFNSFVFGERERDIKGLCPILNKNWFCRIGIRPVSPSVPEMEGIYMLCHCGHPFLRMSFWRSWGRYPVFTRMPGAVTVDNSGVCCSVPCLLSASNSLCLFVSF